MATRVKVERPNEKTIAWFVKHVGPRTHYLPTSIGGKGWRFVKTFNHRDEWYLTVDDEKNLSYYFLMK